MNVEFGMGNAEFGKKNVKKVIDRFSGLGDYIPDLWKN
jgi:hypothetical protein